MADKPLYEVKVPNGLMDYFQGTPVMTGDEQPDIKAELGALKWTGKGATGSVTLRTLGWMAGTAESYAEHDGLHLSARKAGEAAAERYADAYEVARKAETPEPPAGTLLGDGLVVPLDYGQPVWHVRDKSRCVGFLRPDKFTPIEDVRAELERANV